MAEQEVFSLAIKNGNPDPIKWPQLTSSTDNQLDLEGSLKLQPGVAITKFSNDAALTGNSDLALPTERAVKTYVDNQLGPVNTALATKASLAGAASQDFTTRNLTVQDNGNVVGSLTVQKDLKVQSDLRLDIDSSLQFQGNGQIRTAGGFCIFTDTPALTEMLTILSNRNVGIGTTNPQASLHVVGNLLGAAKGPAGEALRVAVGTTTSGATNWVQYDAANTGMYVDIDTSSAGFSTVPYYFTNLSGASSHWSTQGSTSIYTPTANNFRVYVYAPGTTVAQATVWQWHIQWLAIGS